MTAPVIAPFTHGYAVEVERGDRNRYGDISYVVTHTLQGCAWAPRTSNEDDQNRTTVIDGLTLFGPFDSDLRYDDRVVLPDVPGMRGTRKERTYRLVGEIGSWFNPFTGWRPGFSVALERVS